MRLIRGESTVAAPALPPAEEVETDVGRLLLPAADAVMRPLMASTGDWEINEAALFRTFLRRGLTVVDIGAHVGYYTLLAARAVGRRGRVVAVEPDPVNGALLRENIRRNGLRNVQVQAVAAWRENTTLFLRRHSSNTGDHRVATTLSTDESVHKIRAVALDDVLGQTHVSLVKTDAQGADHVALEGMTRTLLRCRPVVFTEFWPEGIRDLGDDPDKVIDAFREFGYRITMIGFDADFSAWSAADIVAAAEQFPFGAAGLVLRPSH